MCRRACRSAAWPNALFSATSFTDRSVSHEHHDQRSERDEREQRLHDRHRTDDRAVALPALGSSASAPASSCSAASAAASHSAARPNSAIIGAPSSSGLRHHRARLFAGHVLHLARHVFLVVLGEQVVGDERAVRRELPSATTPDPSTNRPGAIPRNCTGTCALPSVTRKSIVTPSGSVRSEPFCDHAAQPDARSGAGGCARDSLGM